MKRFVKKVVKKPAIDGDETGKVAQEPVEPKKVTETVEEVILHMQNAIVSADLAIKQLEIEKQSFGRLINAKQQLTVIIKNLLPYLND
jgi:hypothetical protein